IIYYLLFSLQTCADNAAIAIIIDLIQNSFKPNHHFTAKSCSRSHASADCDPHQSIPNIFVALDVK
ncbi:MAG: hypothetical protein KAU50_08345, partial [Candidatus Marinimicrobia bacterium]|nr:hypothetical protein [Candidatus Neomarinimicrobiota bacterium]